MHNKKYIIIPGVKEYKCVDFTTGDVTKTLQSKIDSERISDIMIFENSHKHLLFRIENRELTLFLTSKCNQRCIMCPQKLDIDTPDNDLILQRVLDNLDYEVLDGICFTGGEPLLKMTFIEQVIKKAPERIFLTILTNGSIMPSELIMKSSRCKLCVPLYAPFDVLHNKMTESPSFYKIIKNLMKFSTYEIAIELRFVVTKLNSCYLEEYARFVWRNLPFVQNVAFMGIELTANAYNNKSDLWISPIEYISSLQKAVSYLNSCGIRTWIYNLPYCLFDKSYRKFLVKSISPWKIKYISKCNSCEMKSDCGGMFFSTVAEFEKIFTNNLEYQNY